MPKPNGRLFHFVSFWDYEMNTNLIGLQDLLGLNRSQKPKSKPKT